ncbi:MAG: DNA-processing protein DprA, partial [Minisyncoccia bacterium]
DKDYPDILRSIPAAPKQLYCIGTPLNELLKNPTVAIVGSRKITSYGQRVTADIASSLANRGIVIVSGLALGVDAAAHQAAILAGGKCIAVLPCGLDQIYPATNRNLARKLLETGGAIITEYPEHTEAFKSNFVARNRIVSGLARALVITEAVEKSGSLHTAGFALEQGREVCAVPGNIYSPSSAGTNNLIKKGATPVIDAIDVLRTIGLADKPKKKQRIMAANQEEFIIMTLINEGVFETDELLAKSELPPDIFNQTLTMLEIGGRIQATSGKWYLV